MLGTDPSVPPTVAQVQQLGYIRQILDETLRLWPTAPAFTRQARQATTVGGWGPVRARPVDHRTDPDAAPADRDLGRRTPRSSTRTTSSPQRRDALPPNAFRPFGSGQRACIGRQFALQEATLVLGMLMQRFEFVDHANYQLKIKESLTLKPDGLTITIRPRSGRTWGATPRPVAAAANPRTPALAVAPADRHGTPLLVLFGSNLGASEDIASRIAREATDRGYTARTAGLDDAVGELPTEGAVVVVTSSYNGQPPDNAAKFCTWVDDPATSAAGVRYTVFGCGNRDWAATYQAVPTRIDAALEARGATRVYPRGEGDARGDFDGQFEAWYAGLWDALSSALGLDAGATAAAGSGPRLAVELEQRRTASPILQSYRGQAAIVRVNRELTARAGTPGGRSVRHIEIALPPGRDLRRGRPPRGAAAQRGLPDQPGDRPLRPGRGPVRHAHRDRRRPDPPAPRRALPAAGHPGGLRRAAGRREPRGPGGDGGPHARRPRPRRARGPGRHRRRGEGPLPGADRRAPAHAARPARGAPRVRPAVRGVPRPAAAACARATTRSPRRRR